VRTVEDRDTLDVARIRRDFPILETKLYDGLPLVYLDNAASTHTPLPVVEAITRCYTSCYANVHRGVHWLSEQTTAAYEEARDKVRGFLNAAHAEEVVFTRGTTEGINLVARSWGDANLRAGDEILLTELEHHSNLVPWQQLSERTGAVIRYIPVNADGQLQWEQLDELLTARVKLVAMAAVSNVLGTILPLEKIIPRAHEVGARVLVDAAQSVPHMPTDVQALGCDFLAFSGHKMCGSSGIGALYVRREILAGMPPFQGGGSMIRKVEMERSTYADPPQRFEAGTPAIVPAIALGAAVDYLQTIGLDAIHEHERRLTKRAHELLSTLSGVRLLGPEPDDKAGVVSFTLVNQKGREIHPHDVAHLLDRQGVAVRAGHHCTMPLHRKLCLSATTRASFYLYNTWEEVEVFVTALDKVKHVFQR